MQIRGPVALGIHWAHDAAVSVCTPDGILFSLAEERVTRIKHYYGFPIQAIRKALDYCDLRGDDVDLFAFSAKKPFFPHHKNYSIVTMKGLESSVCEREGLGRPGPRVPLGESRPGKRLDPQWKAFERRHWMQYVAELEDLGFFHPRMKCYYVEHHRAHASSAFRLSGMAEACVLTLDGKGDGLCGSISLGRRDGSLELHRTSPKEASVGSFYQAVTEALGFVPVDGEFKTMGLAAAGKPDGRPNPFRDVVRVRDGRLEGNTAWEFRSYNETHPQKAVDNPLSSVAQADDYERMLTEIPREQLAFHAQQLCEDVMLDFARQAMEITGSRRLACAGGVMLNVKANGRIRDELGVAPEDFFVYPDSSDAGLSAGAAMEALFHEGALSGVASLRTPYLGHDYDGGALREALTTFPNAQALVAEDCGGNSAQVTAEKLSRGIVVGTFQGRLEMGPRALGNRSVLADPRDVAIKERINGLLKGREWFVPFAPIVLEEDAGLYWDGSTHYPYMTFSVKAKPYALEAVPAVVHLDGTMRPQVVTKASNPWLHDVLTAFKALTGVGVLVNTSFNRHGHAIVGSPTDALCHLHNGWIDALILGSWYVERRSAAAGGQP
jgi:carbamoyltransferase